MVRWAEAGAPLPKAPASRPFLIVAGQAEDFEEAEMA
jgi:hypothetical protein